MALELKQKHLWTREFQLSVMTGFFLLFISLIINYKLGLFAQERVSLPVTDLILSNIRTYDVGWIIIWGTIAVILFVALVLLSDQKRLPFVLKSVALFIAIRAVFISLTHIGPFAPDTIVDPTGILRFIGIGISADLFFSGHTGMPFLLSMIYWDNKKFRYIFLAVCIFFAISVLMGHLHYSIDVFSAFFITYAIFEITKKLFARDWQISRDYPKH